MLLRNLHNIRFELSDNKKIEDNVYEAEQVKLSSVIFRYNEYLSKNVAKQRIL